MDNGIDPLQRGAERGRLGDVTLRELDAPGREPRRTLRIADERAHRQLAGAQGMHDVRTDEAGSACDEHGHSKFL